MCPSPDSPPADEVRKLRVLVVDDEPTLRLGFAYALTTRTTEVETAATGRIALEKLAQKHFDIMILDLRMPDIDGLGVIEILRGQGNRIPIVLCSAVLNPHSALRAIHHGVMDFLLKPVRPADLREVIRFVTQPERRPLPLALRSARLGRIQDAIDLLETDLQPSRRAIGWLQVLRAIAHGEDGGAALQETLRHGMPALAFNNAPVS